MIGKGACSHPEERESEEKWQEGGKVTVNEHRFNVMRLCPSTAMHMHEICRLIYRECNVGNNATVIISDSKNRIHGLVNMAIENAIVFRSASVSPCYLSISWINGTRR